MVAGDSGRDQAAQGSAVLSPVRRERRDRIRRLCLGAELASRYVRRAYPPSAGGGGVREGCRRRLSAAQFPDQLTTADSCIGACPFRKTGVHFSGTCACGLRASTNKRRAVGAPFRLFVNGRESDYCVLPGAGGVPCSSFLRASSARRCSSSCSFFCCSSNTFGSVGGPS